MDIIKTLHDYGDILENEPLAKHTTFKVGGNAKYFIYPRNEIALWRIIEIFKKEQIPFRIFGKGSNILCSDKDYDGAVICLDRYLTNYYFEADGTCVAQAGTSIIMLAMEAMKRGLSGLEFASGIPATIGGAIYMNAGAYKNDMTDVLSEVLVLNDEGLRWMSIAELQFSYRTTIFQTYRDWLIVAGKFKLTKGDEDEIRILVETRRERRIETQPLNLPSAGSTFRNPVGHASWKLIDDLGFRGKQIGGAQVSEKHSNFLVNVKNAKAKEIMELITMIQKEVKEQYGIDLQLEVECFNW